MASLASLAMPSSCLQYICSMPSPQLPLADRLLPAQARQDPGAHDMQNFRLDTPQAGRPRGPQLFAQGHLAVDHPWHDAPADPTMHTLPCSCSAQAIVGLSGPKCSSMPADVCIEGRGHGPWR